MTDSHGCVAGSFSQLTVNSPLTVTGFSLYPAGFNFYYANSNFYTASVKLYHAHSNL